MHRTALILTALLCAVDVVGAAPVPLAETTFASTGAALTGLWLPFADSGKRESDDQAVATSATAAAPAEPPVPGPTPVQEIVAGVLTGSLAAVLMLKLLYRRRRRRDRH